MISHFLGAGKGDMGEMQKERPNATIEIVAVAVMLCVTLGYTAGWWSGATIFSWLFAFTALGLFARVLIWLFR